MKNFIVTFGLAAVLPVSVNAQHLSICESAKPVEIPAHNFVRGVRVIKSAAPHDSKALSSPTASASWEYEFTASRECTMMLSIEYATVVTRTVRVSRKLVPSSGSPGSGAGRATEHLPIAETIGSSTGKWSKFADEKIGMIGFLPGYINVLVFEANGRTPIPHIRAIRLTPAL